MSMIEKYKSQQLTQELVPVEIPVTAADASSPSLIVPILRRWYIILITFVVICMIGIPAIWFLLKPQFIATAAIRVAPIMSSILFSDRDSEGVLPMYRNFMNTQAELIKTNQVLQRVADDLADKKLEFFQDTHNPVIKLREALTNESITVKAGRTTNLIEITMKSQNSAEAARIVDSFVKAYMAIEISKEIEGGDHTLTVLESERKVLVDKLQRQRKIIRQMAEEYGTTVLTGRQEIMLQHVASLQAKLTEIQARRITLEVQQQLLEGTDRQTMEPDKLVKMRYEFINSNPTIQALSANITQLDQSLIVAKQTLVPTNPELKRKKEVLDALKSRLEEKEDELGKTFNNMMSKEVAVNREAQLANVKIELARMTDYEKRLQGLLNNENSETIGLGRKHLAIQDQQEQLGLTKELHDTVRRRLQQLEMERKRPARVTVAYYANVAPVRNKRIKLLAALTFGSLGFGILIAFLIAKADSNLYTPEDVFNRIGVRIIGTTTNASHFDTLKLPRQLVCDYQAIRANLGLLDGGKIPNKLVVTSPGMRDGKTTFAINIATSLAKSGKKILLIDGDLRKPEIRLLLNLHENSQGLQDIIWGKSLESSVCTCTSTGFDVLLSNGQSMSQAFELLSLPHVAERLNEIGLKYDHVIIDTPPILAFPDALLWAKMADGVVVTSFAGHTSDHDLKKTLERLDEIKANVLGIILHNVHIDHSYNRYSYSYYMDHREVRRKHRKKTMAILLQPMENEPQNHEDSRSS